MKLNQESKNEIRKEVEELLKNVPEGKRINIYNEEILEELLFDTVIFDFKGTTIKFKLPVWSGEFLRKIDLSKVDFEDVSWSLIHDEVMLDELGGLFGFDEEDEDFVKLYDDVLKKYVKWYDFKTCPKVDYSMTNANIDFTKSFEFKKKNHIEIENCDFSGIDLSNLDASKLGRVYNSNLSDTKLNLSPELLSSNSINVFWSTNLTNVDLSKFNVDIISLFDDETYFDDRCDFTNTGLHVTLDSAKLKQAINDNTMVDGDLEYLMTRLKGCYVNDKKVLSDEENGKLAANGLIEYEKYKNEILDSIKNSIYEQIGGTHK